MLTRLIALSVVATSLSVVSRAATSMPPVRVILVGDSTMAASSGYGNALCARLRPEVTCLNLARGGRSSKSYRAEGLWSEVLGLLSDQGNFAATYVLIQFGHNDQPGKAERSTTLPEFEQNMRAYVRDVRAAGGTPILVTPLTRRQFKDGKVVQDLAPWADLTRKVAKENRTALLDLNRDSVAAVQTMGSLRANQLARVAPPPEVTAAALTGTTIEVPKPAPVDSATSGNSASSSPSTDTNAASGTPAPLTPTFDYTHLGPRGAEVFSAMVVKEIRQSLPPMEMYLLPTPSAP
jgi:lysophospholipase L1-like esterase